MSKMPKEVRDRIAKARATAGGNNIRHGEYLFMIMRSTYERMNSGQCHINEFVVHEAKKIVVVEGEKTIESEPNQPGSMCSYVINYDGKGKLSADGNSKALVLGLFGMKESEVDDNLVADTLGDFTDDSQPAKGMLVKCITYPKEVRSKPGKYITGLIWECASPPGSGLNTPELCVQRLEAYAKHMKQNQA